MSFSSDFEKSHKRFKFFFRMVVAGIMCIWLVQLGFVVWSLNGGAERSSVLPDNQEKIDLNSSAPAVDPKKVISGQ